MKVLFHRNMEGHQILDLLKQNGHKLPISLLGVGYMLQEADTIKLLHETARINSQFSLYILMTLFRLLPAGA